MRRFADEGWQLVGKGFRFVVGNLEHNANLIVLTRFDNERHGASAVV